jgi:hypothetical protein
MQLPTGTAGYELSSGSGVTQALYAAGFNASSRFYEQAPEMLGMKPSAYRAGGQGEAVWHAVGRCSLGSVLVAATGRGLCAILLGDDPSRTPSRRSKSTLSEGENIGAQSGLHWLGREGNSLRR